MTAVFCVLLSANAYVFFWRKRTSLPELHRRADGDRRNQLPSAAIGGEANAGRSKSLPLPSSAQRWLSFPGNGRTLGERFTDAGLPPAALPLALLNDKERAHVTAYVGLLADGQLAAIDLVLLDGKSEFFRKEGKLWVNLPEPRLYKIRQVALASGIGSSLMDALSRLPAHDSIGNLVVTLLASEIDFDDKSDRNQGKNRVRVLVDRHEINGQVYRYGALHAVEWQSDRRGLYRAIEYPLNSGRFYTERGEAVEKRWLRSPFPSVLATETRRAERAGPGQWRASPGTPLSAMSEGRVVFLSKNAKGATVTISRDDLQVTMRGDFRPLSTIRVGATVMRGQPLAVVAGSKQPGVTSSLFVELSVAGKRIDPAMLPPRLPACSADERPQLGEQIAVAVKELSTASDDRLAAR